MISIWNGYNTFSINNNDKEEVSMNTTERREIEELTGVSIEKMTTAQIRSNLSLIRIY